MPERRGALGMKVKGDAGTFWVRGTMIAAAAATAIDAAVIQQKKSFFTGGFLTATHTDGAAEAAGFLAASFIVDASATGVFALMLLWATARVRLTRMARLFLVVAGSLAPLVIWNFISYSLLSYLGDAFDFGLMFDLAGRDLGEILAVASAHVAGPAALSMLAFGSVAAGAWAVNRLTRARERATVRVTRRLVTVAAMLLAAGMATSAVGSATDDVLEDGLRRKPTGNTYTRIVAALTDFDGDGYGIGGRTSDPAPFDGSIYPYALDIPGNGIDENGEGGDLPSAEPAYGEVPAVATPWRHRPHVVLFVLESFRADAVGAVVNGKPVTPVLDALGREGVSSARAYSHNGYTVASRLHLFSGSLAGLREGSLVDDFRANGYETAYFSGQDESFGGPAAGVGFDRVDVAYDARQDRDRRYSTFTTAGSLAVSHATLQERIEGFLALRDRASSRPLFLYVNFHDTHFPYHHGEIEPLVSDKVLPQGRIAPSRKDALHEMYQNTAANVDRALGRTLHAVTRALESPPAVIVTADHGESLFDEGFLGHGYALDDVQTRIPLIVRGLPMEVGEPFGQSDLRDALARALSGEAAGDGPRLVAVPGKQVFQYLGNIHRPRQIAFADGAGRTIYDFRDNRAAVGGRPPVRPNDLPAADETPFLALVHFWERMMLARAAGGKTPVE